MADPGAPLPTGTVTFLLTDVEGSTRLWDEHPNEMAVALARHDGLIAEAVTAHGGALIKTRGEGDSTFSVFEGASAAVAAAVAIQRALGAEQWPGGTEIRARVAIHTGEVELRDGDYYGGAVNRAARVRGVAHGGQVLVTESTAQLVADDLPDGATLHDLGIHRLRDLARPEHVYELRHAALRSDFPPLRSLEARSHNLPIELTSFVGREQELTELTKLVAEHRLVTLTGLGGSGKTRLALHAAAASIDEFPDGVWLVELAKIADGALVAGAVAAVLGVREQPGQDIADAIADELLGRSMLLVVDNCEHVIEAAAAVVEHVLRTCPGVRVLATSRQPLGVPGEATYFVQPLALPASDAAVTADDLHEFDALRLFADRASLVRHDADLRSSAPAIARVCRQLDGIPLAIELAAARVSALSIEQLADRLDDRFRVLTAGPRLAERRQQTLRAAIDWSYELLSEPERELFRRLAVFPAGATLEAIEAVCGDCLDALGQLVDKSLVLLEANRYRMLETIRAYATERLDESGEADAVHRAHFEWVAQLVPKHGDKTQALDAEAESIRAATRWAIDDGNDVGRGVQLVTGCIPFWQARGHWAEAFDRLTQIAGHDAVDPGMRSLCATQAANFAVMRGRWEVVEDLALQAVELAQNDDQRARALLVRANARHAAGRTDDAIALWKEAVTIERVNRSPLLVPVLGNLGVASAVLGRAREARAYYEEALASDPSPQHAELIGVNLGNVLIALGDYEAAEPVLLGTLDRADDRGDKRARAESLRNLGKLRSALGDDAAATVYLEEAADLSREIEDRMSLSTILVSLAEVHARMGRFDQARAELRESLALVDGTHERLAAARHVALAAIEAAAGNGDAAAAELSLALDQARDSGWALFTAETLRVAGFAAIVRGRAEVGARLLGSADVAWHALDDVPSPPERAELEAMLDRARGELGDEAFARAWEAGRQMTAADALDLAAQA